MASNTRVKPPSTKPKLAADRMTSSTHSQFGMLNKPTTRALKPPSKLAGSQSREPTLNTGSRLPAPSIRPPNGASRLKPPTKLPPPRSVNKKQSPTSPPELTAEETLALTQSVHADFGRPPPDLGPDDGDMPGGTPPDVMMRSVDALQLLSSTELGIDDEQLPWDLEGGDMSENGNEQAAGDVTCKLTPDETPPVQLAPDHGQLDPCSDSGKMLTSQTDVFPGEITASSNSLVQPSKDDMDLDVTAIEIEVPEALQVAETNKMQENTTGDQGASLMEQSFELTQPSEEQKPPENSVEADPVSGIDNNPVDTPQPQTSTSVPSSSKTSTLSAESQSTDSSKKRPRSPTPSKPESSPPKRPLKQTTAQGRRLSEVAEGKKSPAPKSPAKSGNPSTTRSSTTAKTTTASVEKVATLPKKPVQSKRGPPKLNVAARGNAPSQESHDPTETDSVSSHGSSARGAKTSARSEKRPSITPKTTGPAGRTTGKESSISTARKNSTVASKSATSAGRPGAASTKSNAKSSETSQAGTRRTSVQPTSARSGVDASNPNARGRSASTVLPPSRPGSGMSGTQTDGVARQKADSSASAVLARQLSDQLASQHAELAVQETRLSELRQEAEQQQGQLVVARQHLHAALTGFDAMATVVTRLSWQLDTCGVEELCAELKSAKVNCEGLQSQIEDLRERKERLVLELQEQSSRHSEDMTALSADHAKQVREVERRIAQESDTALQKVFEEHSQEVVNMKQNHEKELDEIANQYEGMMRNLRDKHTMEIEEISCRDRNHIKELQRQHDDKLHEMTQRFEEMKVTLSNKLSSLQSECNELRSKATFHEDSVHKDSDHKFQWGDVGPLSVPGSPRVVRGPARSPRLPRSPLSPRVRRPESGETTPDTSRSADSFDLQLAIAEYQHLPQEIESLKVVLDMKNEEIAEQRKQNMELHEKLEELKQAHNQIKQLKYKIENLEAIIDLKSDGEKQLHDRYQLLFKRLDQESKAKKRISMDYEELRYKLEEAQQEEEGAAAQSSLMTTSVVMRGPTSDGGRTKVHRGLQHDRSKRRTLASSRELDPA